jgi:hypothetical protein
MLILGISFLRDVMNLLLDGLDLFNKYGCIICLGLSVGNLSVKMQHEELYRWGLMVGTSTTLEKGCGQ